MNDSIGMGLAQFGNSFMKARESKLDREQRQAELDSENAWKNEQRNQQRQKWAQEAALKQSLSDAKALDLQASKAKTEQAQIDEHFNNEVMRIATNRPDWWVDAADMATNSKFGPIKDFSVDPVLSKDGKRVQFVAKGTDGKAKVMGEFSADEAGAQKWVQASAKVDTKTKLGWLADRMKYTQETERDQAKHGYKMEEIGASGSDGEGGRKAPSGYRWNAEGSGLEAIPGGPATKGKSLSSMDRMLIDGRRTEAKKDMKAIEEQLNDPILLAMSKKDGPDREKVLALQSKLKDAKAEFDRWDGAMSEFATTAMNRNQGLSSASSTAAPRSAADSSGSKQSGKSFSYASTEAEKDRYTILHSELAKAKQSGNAEDVRALEAEIGRLPKSSAAIGLSSAAPKNVQAKKITTLPSGSKKIGTSGGKAVYQLPDGSKFITE